MPKSYTSIEMLQQLTNRSRAYRLILYIDTHIEIVIILG